MIDSESMSAEEKAKKSVEVSGESVPISMSVVENNLNPADVIRLMQETETEVRPYQPSNSPLGWNHPEPALGDAANYTLDRYDTLRR